MTLSPRRKGGYGARSSEDRRRRRRRLNSGSKLLSRRRPPASEAKPSSLESVRGGTHTSAAAAVPRKKSKSDKPQSRSKKRVERVAVASASDDDENSDSDSGEEEEVGTTNSRRRRIEDEDEGESTDSDDDDDDDDDDEVVAAKRPKKINNATSAAKGSGSKAAAVIGSNAASKSNGSKRSSKRDQQQQQQRERRRRSSRAAETNDGTDADATTDNDEENEFVDDDGDRSSSWSSSDEGEDEAYAAGSSAGRRTCTQKTFNGGGNEKKKGKSARTAAARLLEDSNDEEEKVKESGAKDDDGDDSEGDSLPPAQFMGRQPRGRKPAGEGEASAASNDDGDGDGDGDEGKRKGGRGDVAEAANDDDDDGASEAAAVVPPKAKEAKVGKEERPNAAATSPPQQQLQQQRRRRLRSRIVPTSLPRVPKDGDDDVVEDPYQGGGGGGNGEGKKKREGGKSGGRRGKGDGGNEKAEDGEKEEEEEESLNRDEVEEYEDTSVDEIVEENDEDGAQDEKAGDANGARSSVEKTVDSSDDDGGAERSSAPRGNGRRGRRKKAQLLAGTSSLENTPVRKETVRWSPDVAGGGGGRGGQKKKKNRGTKRRLVDAVDSVLVEHASGRTAEGKGSVAMDDDEELTDPDLSHDDGRNRTSDDGQDDGDNDDGSVGGFSDHQQWETQPPVDATEASPAEAAEALDVGERGRGSDGSSNNGEDASPPADATDAGAAAAGAALDGVEESHRPLEDGDRARGSDGSDEDEDASSSEEESDDGNDDDSSFMPTQEPAAAAKKRREAPKRAKSSARAAGNDVAASAAAEDVPKIAGTKSGKAEPKVSSARRQKNDRGTADEGEAPPADAPKASETESKTKKKKKKKKVGKKEKAGTAAEKKTATSKATNRKQTNGAKNQALSIESRQIVVSIQSLNKICREYIVLLEGIDEVESGHRRTFFDRTLRGIVDQFRSLSSVRSAMTPSDEDPKKFHEAFEQAAVAFKDGSTATRVLETSLTVVFHRTFDSNEMSEGERSRRFGMLCTCLRFFVDTETSVDVFSLFHHGTSASILSESMSCVISFPSIVAFLLKTIGAHDSLHLQSSAAALALGCLSSISPNDVVRSLAVTSKKETESSKKLKRALRTTAGSVHLMGSYPQMELTLLFLVRVRRELLLAYLRDKDEGSSTIECSKQELEDFDFAFTPAIRDKLSSLDMSLPLHLRDVLLSGNGCGEEQTLPFTIFARECLGSSTGRVASFECIGVYCPVNGDMGLRIADIPWIDVSDEGLSFFASETSGDESIIASTHNTMLGGNQSSEGGPLSPEAVYSGRHLVQVKFDDLNNDAGGDTKQPIAYFSQEDCAISIHLSPSTTKKSNLSALKCHADDYARLRVDTSPPSGYKVMPARLTKETSPHGQNTVLRLMPRRNGFPLFLRTLENHGVSLVRNAESGSVNTASSYHEIGQASRTTQGNGATGLDHLELTTRGLFASSSIAMRSPRAQQPPSMQSDAIIEDSTNAVADRDAKGLVASAVSMDTPSSKSLRGLPTDSRLDDAVLERGIEGNDRFQPDSRHAAMPQRGPAKRTRDEIHHDLPEMSPPEARQSLDGHRRSHALSPLREGGKRARTDSENIESHQSEGVRKVTPLPPTAGLAQKHASIATEDLSQCLDSRRFSTLENSNESLESLSALCFALSIAGKGSPADGISGIQNALPDSMSQVKRKDLAESVLAMDKALARAADTMNTVSRLAHHIVEARGGSMDDDSCRSPFEWVDRTCDQIRFEAQKWSAQRTEVSKQLHDLLLQTLVSKK